MTYSSWPLDELIRLCATTSEPEPWQEFVYRSEKLISAVIWRIARRYSENNHAVIEDLVQETYIKVCENQRRLLQDFKPYHQDAFFGMLKVIAANVARDYYRARNTTKRGSGKVNLDVTETESFIPNMTSGYPNQMERQVLIREIDSILGTICSGERDREIFWLHYRQGLTANSIAQIDQYGLTAKGVESILHRLRTQLRSRLAEKRPVNTAIEGIQDKTTLSQGEGQL